MSDTLADRLASFARETRFEDLPSNVVIEARRRLLDAIGFLLKTISNDHRGRNERSYSQPPCGLSLGLISQQVSKRYQSFLREIEIPQEL